MEEDNKSNLGRRVFVAHAAKGTGVWNSGRVLSVRATASLGGAETLSHYIKFDGPQNKDGWRDLAKSEHELTGEPWESENATGKSYREKLGCNVFFTTGEDDDNTGFLGRATSVKLQASWADGKVTEMVEHHIVLHGGKKEGWYDLSKYEVSWLDTPSDTGDDGDLDDRTEHKGSEAAVPPVNREGTLDSAGKRPGSLGETDPPVKKHKENGPRRERGGGAVQVSPDGKGGTAPPAPKTACEKIEEGLSLEGIKWDRREEEWRINLKSERLQKASGPDLTENYHKWLKGKGGYQRDRSLNNHLDASTKLFAGEGVRCNKWPEDVVFLEGQKIDLTWDFVKLCRRARGLHKHFNDDESEGADPGHGWAVDTFLGKIRQYQLSFFGMERKQRKHSGKGVKEGRGPED